MATVATKHRKLSAQKEKKHTHWGSKQTWPSDTLKHKHTPAHTHTGTRSKLSMLKSMQNCPFLRRRTNDVEWRDLASARGEGREGSAPCEDLRSCVCRGNLCSRCVPWKWTPFWSVLCCRSERVAIKFYVQVQLKFVAKKHTAHTRACKNTHTHTVGQAETYFYDTPKGNWQCPAGQQPGQTTVSTNERVEPFR